MSSSLQRASSSFRKSFRSIQQFKNRHRPHRMVSVRSATWACLLLQLVLSCTAIVASVAVVCAQSQSTSAKGIPLGPSPGMLFVCALSFCLLASSVLGMFGLQGRRPLLLIPIIIVSIIVCTFHSMMLSKWMAAWWKHPKYILEPDGLITFTGCIAFQFAFIMVTNISIIIQLVAVYKNSARI